MEVAARTIHDAESGIAREQWERAWIASQIAMNVTRRSFLTGHDGAWVEERRSELGAVYVRAVAALSAAALQLGDTELLTAERAARELVAAEPLSEGATALLMRALDARGERPAALVVVRRVSPAATRGPRRRTGTAIAGVALRDPHALTRRQRRANALSGIIRR